MFKLNIGKRLSQKMESQNEKRLSQKLNSQNGKKGVKRLKLEGFFLHSKRFTELLMLHTEIQ